MKFGPIDGSPEEIRDLLKNDGLKLTDYFERPATMLQSRYVVLPAVVLGVGLVAVVSFAGSPSKNLLRLLDLLSVGGVLWLIVSVQLRFRQTAATLATALGSLLMLMIAKGILSLPEVTEILKDLWKKA